jgi:hypothetical protein
MDAPAAATADNEALLSRGLNSSLGADMVSLHALPSELPRQRCPEEEAMREQLEQLRALQEELERQYPHGLPVGSCYMGSACTCWLLVLLGKSGGGWRHHCAIAQHLAAAGTPHHCCHSNAPQCGARHLKFLLLLCCPAEEHPAAAQAGGPAAALTGLWLASAAGGGQGRGAAAALRAGQTGQHTGQRCHAASCDSPGLQSVWHQEC